MLVLSRKVKESIIIGGDIEVKVVHIGRDRVKLAIKAPPDVRIYRSEVVNSGGSDGGSEI